MVTRGGDGKASTTSGSDAVAGALTGVVDKAIALTDADFGNIQILDARSFGLTIVAQRGFPDWWLEFWSSVRAGEGCCGAALKGGGRIVVADVDRSPIFAGTPALEIQRRAGVRAVQSTPLVDRAGALVGMLSTHYGGVLRFGDLAARRLDALARRAADIISEPVHIRALRDAICEEHGCGSTWLGSTSTYSWSVDSREEQAATVEVFRLLGHPEAEQAYAWHRRDGSGHHVVLRCPPIDGPLDALRAVNDGPEWNRGSRGRP